jgi:isopentenyl phosphate kinase
VLIGALKRSVSTVNKRNATLLTSSAVSEDGKKVVVLDDNVLEINALLRSGFIPVLHGDAMLDANTNQMATILSGDVIMRHLAAKFNGTRAVFISDVEVCHDIVVNVLLTQWH